MTTVSRSRPQQQIGNFLLNYGFYLVMLIAILYFGLNSNNFLTVNNLFRILNNAAPSIVIASGLALVVMTGKLDISVGSIAFVSTTVGLLLILRQEVPVALGLLIMLAVGALLGAVNGFIVVVLKVNPLITTIGTMIALRGVAFELTEMRSFSVPEEMRQLSRLALGPLTIEIIIAFLVVIGLWFLHTRTPFGRQVTAIGNGVEVAERLGVRVGRVTFLTFVISGLMGALGGIFLMFQVDSVHSRLGEGYEFTAIALIVIGGISLFGGKGSIFGLIPGALTLTIIEAGLIFIAASPFAYPFVRGGIIFVAMYADSLKSFVRPRGRVEDESPGASAPS
jgi:ribose/xylose/arabinose/galactoside ABC-type transport system permease subunit